MVNLSFTKENCQNDINNGMSLEQIYKKYNKNKSTGKYWIKKWGLKSNFKSFENGYNGDKTDDPESGFQLCNLCNENKSLNEYSYRKDRKVHHRTCKKCHNKKIRDKKNKTENNNEVEEIEVNGVVIEDEEVEEIEVNDVVIEDEYIEEIEVNGVVIEDEDIDENVNGVSIRYSDWENILAINKKQFYELLREAKETHTSKNKFAIRLHAKFPFKFSCGHTECCTYNKFISQSNESERLCKDCNIKKKQNQGITTMKTEENTEDYLKEIIDNNIIDFVLCPEGCAVDMRFKPINVEVDLWFPVQLKSSDNTTNTGFNLKGKYDTQYKYQLLLCHHLNKNNIFIFKPFSEIKPKKTITISYETGNSKYLKFKLNNHNDLTNILLDYYYNPEYYDLLKSGETFDDMIDKNQKLERKYEKIRLDTIRFMNFVRYRNRPHDFKVNDIVNVQEKTRNKDNRCVNAYHFNLVHSDGSANGQKKNKPYDIGDNEFYWLNLAGTKIFYVIPEEHLLDGNKIRDNISLHRINMPPRDNYNDQWTYKFRFSYDTISQPEEKSRLLKMFEDKELEMALDVIMDNPEECVVSSLDNYMRDLNIGTDFGFEESKEEN
jgi:transposase